MAKKKKQELQIHDFFGNYNTYRIFALRSELPGFSFANKLGKTFDVSFTVLPDFDYASNKLSAQFAVFYAEFTQQESIHCLLLENKTETNQQELFDSKTVKNSHLLNYSLFEESLYLFNNNGYSCFQSNFADMDYLLLLFAKKNIDKNIFSQFLKNTTPFKPEDVTYIIEREQTSAEKKNASLLRDFLCKYEVNANLFSRRKKMELLAPVKQIPKQNLQFPIPIPLENDSLADILQLSEVHLALLRED
jgi:hypothetical protein